MGNFHFSPSPQDEILFSFISFLIQPLWGLVYHKLYDFHFLSLFVTVPWLKPVYLALTFFSKLDSYEEEILVLYANWSASYP